MMAVSFRVLDLAQGEAEPLRRPNRNGKIAARTARSWRVDT